jgi:hypothetical protein
LYNYKARFYDPYITHFIQPDTIVPDQSDPQSLNRYSYALNNPIKYNDPSGHFAWIPVLVAGGALIGAGVSLFSQLHNGGTVNWAAVGTAAIVGSAIGLTVAVAAPLAVGLVGEGLTGAGLLTGSTTIFSAGIAATNTSTTLANAMVGTSSGSATLQSPDYITTDNGDTVVIPSEAQGPIPARNGAGVCYEGDTGGGKGLNSNVTSVRIMDRTERYPNGYVSYYKLLPNDGGYQTLNPYTGQSISRGDPWWHIPLSGPE